MPRVRQISDDDGNRGVRCRKCGCAHHFVVYLRHMPNGVTLRKRQCRHCGHRFTTRERGG